jgi:hypothetical protein
LNFTTSTFSVTQLVEDFLLTAKQTPPVMVSQGYTTSTDLFTPQTITLTPLTVQGFSGTLNLTCAVTATTTGSNPTKPNCLLFQNGASTTTLAVVSAGVQSSVSLVIDATNNAGPGIYSVQVTGTDPVSSLTHTTQAFNVTVRATSTGNSITSGATSGNTVTSTFVLPAGVGITGFTCPLIAGTGITTAGGVDPKTLYITCSFNPTSIAATSTVQTVSVSVTISTVSGTKAALAKPPSFLFAGLFGIPAFALLGLLRGRKSTRSAILRLMAILVICAAALQVVGCSGSFTNSNTTGTNLSTPPGTYYLQVQGTGTDGNKYQSVIQLNVTL